MNFVSYSRLIEDIRAWSSLIPAEITMVMGIPRSGVIAAHLLALHRNVGCQGHTPRRRGNCGWQVTAGGTVLLVDDSIRSGRTLRDFMQRSTMTALTGAVYATERSASMVDFYYKLIEAPRAFEWTLFHCHHMQSACIDMDGVLCEDPRPDENDDGARYVEFIATARPRFLPSYPVHSIVTNRLEKYRPLTEQWLKRHRVAYGNLTMSTYTTRRQRIKAADHAQKKAEYYRQSSAYLFVESNLAFARIIRELSGKPVICTDSMTLA